MKYLTLISFYIFITINSIKAEVLSDLIPINTATHTAVQNGNWFTPSTWNTGTIPSDASIVLIPNGISVTYEGQSSAHIFANRVDGEFICKQTSSTGISTLKFDTFMGMMSSKIQFLANNNTDGNIYVTISPFDIEAHKNGTSGFSQTWNTAAKNHYSDGATVYQVAKEVGPDNRFNTYAQAIAGNTTVTELNRTIYDDGVGVTGRYGWDSTQLSLGLITMGELEIIGKHKLNMSKLAADAPSGQRSVQISDIPLGWEAGDTVVVSMGGNINSSNNGTDGNIIQSISGSTITCAINLNKNHEGRPSDDLHCYAGNLSRNIIFQSANPSQIHQRGHLMAMHNNTNVQIRNASFKHMGRTDKSRLLDDMIWKQWLEPSVFTSKVSALGQEICEMKANPKDEITNTRGRYSIHLHKTGAKSTDNMVHITGCVVIDNPGWAITQHDSYANISENIVYNVTGAGIVSESGSELGFWDNNLVMGIQNGHGYDKYNAALFHDDYLFSGQGLAMKGRGVVCRNNVIVDAKEGVGIINMNPSISNHDRVDPIALANFRPGFEIDQFPLDQNGYSSEGDGIMPVEVALILENTTVIACNKGLRSIERDMGVNHESRSVFDGYYCWGVNQGMSIVYQADYSFKDVFISGNGSANTVGLFMWKHSHNHTFENIKLADLDYGMMVSKLVESGNGALKTRNNGFTPWYLIDLVTENVGSLYQLTNDPPTSTAPYTEHSDNPIHLNSSELVNRSVTFTILDSTELFVDYAANDLRFEIDGIITDDLGSYKMGIEQAEAQGTLREEYPQRIYEFASITKFEEYLQNNGVYYDADKDEHYFIINEVLPNRRTFEYTSFPVRVKILNPPTSGIFASPLTESIIPLNHIISRQATVTQSSTQTGLSYGGSSIDPNPSKAIDGNNNGRINCQLYQSGLLPVGSFSQTTMETEPWYDLDLGEEKLIDYIDIWNTVELNGADIESNSSHFQNFYVLISDTQFGNADLTTARSQANHEYFVGSSGNSKRKISFNNLNVTGRYVRIQALGNTILKLAEVEIIGKNPSTTCVLTGTDTRTECNSFTWIDGVNYTTSNNTATYNIIGGAANGCDSLVTLDLTIVNKVTGTDTRTECNSFTWIDDLNYTASNNTATYNIIGGAANGCDSLVTLDLTIVNKVTGTDTRTECNSFTWIDGVNYTASNNTATYNIIGGAANGCDSLVALDLTIHSISDITTTTSGLIISASNTYATYQWLDCDDNNAILNGETEQSYTATVNGNYAVELTENGCVDTSSCVNITALGIVENIFGNQIMLYPNPSDGAFSIDLGNTFQNIEILITDVSGKLIESKQFSQSQELKLTLEEPAGVYLITIKADNQRATFPLLIE